MSHHQPRNQHQHEYLSIDCLLPPTILLPLPQHRLYRACEKEGRKEQRDTPNDPGRKKKKKSKEKEDLEKGKEKRKKKKEKKKKEKKKKEKEKKRKRKRKEKKKKKKRKKRKKKENLLRVLGGGFEKTSQKDSRSSLDFLGALLKRGGEGEGKRKG